jgi:hypothetical protein
MGDNEVKLPYLRNTHAKELDSRFTFGKPIMEMDFCARVCIKSTLQSGISGSKIYSKLF